MDFSSAVSFIQSFTDLERGVQRSANPTMSLGAVRALLRRLGSPQEGRHTVHVTGSKGKGSTAAMIEGILRQAGRRTALFTSPHLHSYTERIAIDGLAVSEAEFAAAVTALREQIQTAASENGEMSTFGILTALFFWLARAQMPPVEWQIVEVGLGGTFDATNVFRKAEIVVVTPISLEHTAILGDTAEAIAADKAGIIKPGSVCVLARQDAREVVEVIEERCEEVGAELLYVPEHYEVSVTERHVYGQGFTVEGRGRQRALRSPMLGRHQAENAAVAVAVADVMRERGLSLSEGAIYQGIALTRVLGRMEVMSASPLIVADGAHNGASAAALRRALEEYFHWKRCHLVLGCTSDKDVKAIGSQLAEVADTVICCGFSNPRAAKPEAVAEQLREIGLEVTTADTVAAAVTTALAKARSEDLICITGSLYVVAEARERVLSCA